MLGSDDVLGFALFEETLATAPFSCTLGENYGVQERTQSWHML